MSSDIVQLVREKIILEKIVADAEALSNMTPNAKISCESRVLQHLERTNQTLWRLRVRVDGGDGETWRYKVGRSNHMLKMTEQEIVAGMQQFVELVERKRTSNFF